MKDISIPLPDINLGKDYIIKYITSDILANNYRGYGLSPGTKIKLLFKSPSGNPCAYEVLGTVIALRHEDSQNIYVSNTTAYD